MSTRLDKSYADKLDRAREIVFQGLFPWMSILVATLFLERLERVGVTSGALQCSEFGGTMVGGWSL